MRCNLVFPVIASAVMNEQTETSSLHIATISGFQPTDRLATVSGF
jgi:hypothetical protein